MKFNDYHKYPKFSAFLRTYLSAYELIQPSRFQSFAKFCGSDEVARKALRFSAGPLVLVKTPPVQENAFAGEAGGFFPGKKRPNEIWINPTRVKRYEGKDVEASNMFSGQNLERIVLHELVHWGRFQSKQPDLYEGREAGYAFEDEAFRGIYEPEVSCKFEDLFS